MPTDPALPQPPLGLLTGPRAAAWGTRIRRPTSADATEIRAARVLVRKPLLELQDTAREVGAGHTGRYESARTERTGYGAEHVPRIRRGDDVRDSSTQGVDAGHVRERDKIPASTSGATLCQTIGDRPGSIESGQNVCSIVGRASDGSGLAAANRSTSTRAAPRSPRTPLVVGWSAPRTRSRSARVCSYSGMASAQVPRRPGRRRRGCCARSGCRGGRRPAPARGRPGSARSSGIASAQVPRRLVGAGEVVARGQGVGVVGAQDPLAVGQGLLVQRDRLAQVRPPPGRRRRGCCARPGCRGGRRPAPARGRRGSARSSGIARPRSPRRLVGVGEVVARGQGVGVVGAQHPLAVGEGLLVQRDGLAPGRPADW